MKKANITPPSKHVMAGLTFVALLPLVYVIPPWVAANISDQHGWVTLISVASIVPIISYVMLPGMLGVRARLKSNRYSPRERFFRARGALVQLDSPPV